MTSLAEMAKCIGLYGSFSVIKDFFGYGDVSGPFLLLPPLSVSKQLSLLKVKHVNLNIILVGSDSFTPDDRREIDAGIQFARNVYATVNLGIGRVQHFVITNEQANGEQNVGSDSDAEQLVEDYAVQNDGLDVFYVLTGWGGSELGRAPISVTCDKDGKGMHGCVCVPQSQPLLTGTVLAHELGHCLGLEHITGDGRNLMFPIVPNGDQLYPQQAQVIMSHCSIRAPCP